MIIIFLSTSLYIVMEYNKLKFQIQKQNGRVINITENPDKRFNMFKDEDQNLESYSCRLIYGIVEAGPLSKMFFSEKNIQRVQNLLRYRVWKQTQGKFTIDEQSETELVIIMRAIFLQNARNDPTETIVHQVNILNEIVCNYSVANIISKAKQYIGYIQDVESNPVPIEHPRNVSSAGTRLLRSVTSTF